MNMPVHFSDKLPLREQILYVLSLMKKGAATEVAMGLIELKGVSSEEGVAELTVQVEQELEKIFETEAVIAVKGHRQKNRYAMKSEG